MTNTLYFYRNEVISKNEDAWIVIGFFEGLTLNPIIFKTINEAKNAIDKKLGGFSGKCVPKRWLKDEQLKKEYYKYMR
jgi:hypothetical protein